jgi:hypothetical protein
MISDTVGRATPRKSNSSDQELDALVERELEALSTREAHFDPRRRRPSTKHADQAPPARKSGPDTVAVPEADKSSPHENNVIGIRRAAASGERDGIPFSDEEEAFIEQAVAFLRGRENLDVIIEDIWTHAVLGHDDPMGDPLDEDSAFRDDADGTDGTDGNAALFSGGPVEAPGVTDRRSEGPAQSGRMKPSLVGGHPKADIPKAVPSQEPATERPTKDSEQNGRGADGAVE